MQDEKDLERFIRDHCMYCGSQRCIPTDDFWREACTKWQEWIKKEDEEIDDV